jgi:hypothetical protein
VDAEVWVIAIREAIARARRAASAPTFAAVVQRFRAARRRFESRIRASPRIKISDGRWQFFSNSA